MWAFREDEDRSGVFPIFFVGQVLLSTFILVPFLCYKFLKNAITFIRESMCERTGCLKKLFDVRLNTKK